jgi:hypothetical protein
MTVTLLTRKRKTAGKPLPNERRILNGKACGRKTK